MNYLNYAFKIVMLFILPFFMIITLISLLAVMLDLLKVVPMYDVLHSQLVWSMLTIVYIIFWWLLIDKIFEEED